MFKLIWKNEEIDSFETMKEARAMQAEYNLAFGGGVTIQGGSE